MPTTTPNHHLDAPGLACATLTPILHRTMKQLASGDVLEFVCDDPAAREGVPAWSRLTGHVLLDVEPIDADRTRFLLRKK